MASLTRRKVKSSDFPEEAATAFITRAESIADDIAHGERDEQPETATPLKEEQRTVIPAVEEEQKPTATESVRPSLISKRSAQETKSRRFQCVFKPSTFERMQSKATAEGMSVNDILNQLAELYIEGKV